MSLRGGAGAAGGEVRLALQEGDADAIAELKGHSWSKAQIQQEVEATRELAETASLNRVTLVATDGDGRPAAFLCAWVVAGEAQILNLCVSPDSRRKGLATKLVRALLREPNGGWGAVASATLEVASGNAGARALYEKLGFAQEGVRKRYYQCGDDAVLMRLERKRAPGA